MTARQQRCPLSCPGDCCCCRSAAAAAAITASIQRALEAAIATKNCRKYPALQTWELFSRSVAICQCRSPHRSYNNNNYCSMGSNNNMHDTFFLWPVALSEVAATPQHAAARCPRQASCAALRCLIYQSRTIIILLKSANLICLAMLLDKLLPVLPSFLLLLLWLSLAMLLLFR